MTAGAAKPWWSRLPRRLDLVLVGTAGVMDLGLWGLAGQTRFGWTLPPIVVIATAVPTFGLLLRRGVRPRLAYGVAWIYSVGWAALLPFYEPFTALLIAVHHIARVFDLRRALPYLLALAVPWGINVANAIQLIEAGPGVALGIVGVWATLTGLVWITARLAHRAAQVAALRERGLAAEAALAVQVERMRLARELHDSVANAVSATMLQAGGARQLAVDTDPRIQEALAAIEASSTAALREMRRLLRLLAAPEGSQPAGASESDPSDGHASPAPVLITGGGLDAGASLARLDEAIDLARACGLSVSLSVDGEPRALDASVDHAASRVAQEALTNAVKHAGPGTIVTVGLSWGEVLTVCVANSAPPDHSSHPVAEGAALLRGGAGLPGLHARVQSVGGMLSAGPSPDGGFVVVATFPIGDTSLV